MPGGPQLGVAGAHREARLARRRGCGGRRGAAGGGGPSAIADAAQVAARRAVAAAAARRRRGRAAPAAAAAGGARPRRSRPGALITAQRHLARVPAAPQQRHRARAGARSAPQRAARARQVEAPPARGAGEQRRRQRGVAERRVAAGARGRGRPAAVPSTFATTSSTPRTAIARSVPGATSPAASSGSHAGAAAAPRPPARSDRAAARATRLRGLRRTPSTSRPEQVGRGLLERLLDRQLERRRRGRAAVAVALEAQPRDAVLEPQQLDVAAVGLHVRAHAGERLLAPASRASTG